MSFVAQAAGERTLGRMQEAGNLAPDAADGIAIVHDGRRIRLKWHRLRRRMTDPLFSAVALADGFRLGASMELDLRVRVDGGFVVLHDRTLDRETTGKGRIIDHRVDELRDLRFDDRNDAGRPHRALLLSEDLALACRAAHPEALLQFDMKDDLKTVGVQGLDHLERVFGGLSASVIASGADIDLIAAIGERLPQFLLGIDPTDMLVAIYRTHGHRAVGAALRDELAGRLRADTVYLAWKLVLKAREDGLDLVDICHGAGANVDAWTFTLKRPGEGFDDDEWTQFARLLDAKVDQITTDESLATEQAYLARHVAR